NHQTNDFLEYKINKKQIAFAYIDMNPLTVPKFRRFATILSSHEGVGFPVNEVIHLTNELNIQCVIAGREVFVKVPVWYGFITTKVEESNSKSIDLNEVLNQSASSAKDNPELSKVILNVKDKMSVSGS